MEFIYLPRVNTLMSSSIICWIRLYTLMVAKLPHSHGSSLVGVLHRISRLIKKLKLQRGVATEIQDIKSVLADIKRRGESYRFWSIDERSSSGTRNIIPHSRVRSFFVEDDEIVGIESIKDKLLDLMANGRSERSVVALVGEGGLGKTTLAGKLFNNEGLKTHFNCRAWLTVGKEYNKNDLLRTIIKEFHRLARQPTPVEIHNLEEMDLITTLRDHLKDKSYMVVFDDVWKIDFWRDVEHALLDNKKCSRIIVTTRRMNVANFCKSSSSVQVHELGSLPPFSQSLSSPPQYLPRLCLKGNMKKLPDWISKLKNLIRLSLNLSGLTEDPIRVLQALPNLLQLSLVGTYNYELFHFEAGWFPKLQKLELYHFEAVKSVIIEKGAMPDIRELYLGPCPLLMEIPVGIEHLKNLELLVFADMVKQVYCMTKDENWEKVTKHMPDVNVFF